MKLMRLGINHMRDENGLSITKGMLSETANSIIRILTSNRLFPRRIWSWSLVERSGSPSGSSSLRKGP
eukprot:15851074-Heterocapsa_arctica.AAC.1